VCSLRKGISASYRSIKVLAGWQYRKSHVINGSSGAGTGYQVKITVHYGSGVDSASDVYLNSHCRTDFGDVRWAQGSALLSYWMVSLAAGDNAVFYVNVLGDLGQNQTVSIYYGNSNVVTTSSITATMIDSNDFESDAVGSVPASWTEDYPSLFNIRVKNTSWYIESGSQGASVNAVGGGGGFLVHRPLTTINVDNTRAIDFWLKTSANASSHQIHIQDSGNDKFIMNTSYSPLQFQYHNGSAWTAIQNISINTWYHIVIYNISFSNRTFCLDVNDVNQVLNGTLYAAATQLNRFAFRSAGTGQPEYAFDDFLVRKRIPIEPTNGAWGTEQRY